MIQTQQKQQEVSTVYGCRHQGTEDESRKAKRPRLEECLDIGKNLFTDLHM